MWHTLIDDPKSYVGGQRHQRLPLAMVSWKAAYGLQDAA